MKDIFDALAAPFPPTEIEFRAGATNKDTTRALALAYIPARTVMDRLDEAIGPENWQDRYEPGPGGGVICGLSLRINDEWITKWDGADNTQFEAVKGGISDALKRAAVKWGVGRYLYRLPSEWVSCELRGKSVVLLENPRLPEWAVPAGMAYNRKPTPQEALEHKAAASPKGPDQDTQTGRIPETKMPSSAQTKPVKKPVKLGEDAVTMFWQLVTKWQLDKEQAQEVLTRHGGNFLHAYEALKGSLERQ